jgi:hypothetical protein
MRLRSNGFGKSQAWVLLGRSGDGRPTRGRAGEKAASVRGLNRSHGSIAGRPRTPRTAPGITLFLVAQPDGKAVPTFRATRR